MPPGFFSQTDAVLTADHSAHGEDAPEQLIQNTMHSAIVGSGAGRGHQVDVNVAVAGVAKAGNRDAVLS